MGNSFLNDPKIYSMEISYFINNACNLKCKHCYVGYQNQTNPLSIAEWKSLFGELINLGALTFGNVGKEPLLEWDKTRELLKYLREKRSGNPNIRFGFVTNGTLLNGAIISELNEIMPDYIDISVDGNKKIHNLIRGEGNYERLFRNLKLLSEKDSLAKKVFASFTLNKLNAEFLEETVYNLYSLGLKKFLISPYISTNVKDDPLYLGLSDNISKIKQIFNGKAINFKNRGGLEIYIKNDYTTAKDLMEEMKKEKIIDEENLYLDEYGVIFNKYDFNGNSVYVNYLPFNNTFYKSIRISHDGYISDCYSMFFEDYQKRAIGNVREKPIAEILASYLI